MKVMKFGGTSVGTPGRIKDVSSLLANAGEPVFAVLSAMSGTTNSLLEISDHLYKKKTAMANKVIDDLEAIYMKHAEELYSTEEYLNKTRTFLHERFDFIRSRQNCSRVSRKNTSWHKERL